MTVVEKSTTIPDGTWKIDPLHSTAGFAVRHAVATFRGGFRELDASLESAGGVAKLTGSARVDSISVEDENLRPHLLSPEFFDVERTPEVKFTSSSIEPDGDELVVRGELEIKGTRHEVVARGQATAPAVGASGRPHIGLELRAEIDRTDYGLDWNMELPDGGTVLGDEVTLEVSLELIAEEA